MITTDAPGAVAPVPASRRPPPDIPLDGPVRRALRRGAISPWTIEESLEDMSARDKLCLATATAKEGLSDVLLTRVFWKSLVDHVCDSFGDGDGSDASCVLDMLDLLPVAAGYDQARFGRRAPSTLLERVVMRVARVASRGNWACRCGSVDQASMSDVVSAIILEAPRALAMRWACDRGAVCGGRSAPEVCSGGQGCDRGRDCSCDCDRPRCASRPRPAGSRRREVASTPSPAHTNLCLSLARGGYVDALRRVLLVWQDDPAFPVSVRRAFACRGWTALHEAARSGHLTVCALLVEHNACSVVASYSYFTPLDMAVGNGHLDVALYLLCATGAPLSRMAFESVLPRRRLIHASKGLLQGSASPALAYHHCRTSDAREALALVMLDRAPGLCVGSVAPWDAPDIVTLDGLLLRHALLRDKQDSLLSECEIGRMMRSASPRAQTFVVLFELAFAAGGAQEERKVQSEAQQRGRVLGRVVLPRLHSTGKTNGATNNDAVNARGQQCTHSAPPAPAHTRLGAMLWSEILHMSDAFPRQATVDAFQRRVVREATRLSAAVHT